MGGAPKGLLPMPSVGPSTDTGEALVVHAVRVGLDAGFEACWLVGDLAVYDALVDVTQVFRGRLHDEPAGVGPLGGLRALLTAAAGLGCAHVVVVACDMPYLTAPLLAALRTHPSRAPVLAAQRDPQAPWEPMLARYVPSAVLPVLDDTLALGARSFQALFKRLAVDRFEAEGVIEALHDWDSPADLR